MKRSVFAYWAGFLCLVLVATGSIRADRLWAAGRQNQTTSVVATPSQYRAVLDRYCVTCHNEKLRTGRLALDKMDLLNLSQGGEVWEKVARKLRSREMPPAARPRPDQATLVERRDQGSVEEIRKENSLWYRLGGQRKRLRRGKGPSAPSARPLYHAEAVVFLRDRDR